MLDFDKLLGPVTQDAPAGADLAMTVELYELETIARGTPEDQYQAAVEADWRALKKRALDAASRTRDFRVGCYLAAALLRTDGLAGFTAGLKLIAGYMESFWDTAYPQLDPSDNNDPSARMSELSNLAAPLGSDGEFLKIIPTLRALPVVQATRAGRFSLDHYLAAKSQQTLPDGNPAPALPLLEAALKELSPDALKAVRTGASESLEHLVAIETHFREKSVGSLSPTFGPLKQDLKSLLTWFGGESANAPVPSAATDGADASEGGGVAAPVYSAPVREGIQNRDDVLAAIDKIIEYYNSEEPSSPVPFLLKRAKRLAQMDFMQVIMEMAPDARDRIVTITGETGETPPPSY